MLIFHISIFVVTLLILLIRDYIKLRKRRNYSENKYFILYRKKGGKGYVRSALLKYNDAVSRYNVFGDARFLCKVIGDKEEFFGPK